MRYGCLAQAGVSVTTNLINNLLALVVRILQESARFGVSICSVAIHRVRQYTVKTERTCTRILTRTHVEQVGFSSKLGPVGLPFEARVRKYAFPHREEILEFSASTADTASPQRAD